MRAARARPARAALSLVVVAMAMASACQLDRGVLYRCDDAGTPCQPGATCGDDGYCHWEDAGGGGGCVPRDPGPACLGVECGFVDAGCGQEADCRRWCARGLECGVDGPNRCGLPRVCGPEGWCWENPRPLGMDYQAMLAVSRRQVWLGGEQGVAFFDGERTRLEDLGLTSAATVYALAASGPGDVYAVGSRGLVAHLTGGAWRLEDAGTAVTLRAVQAAAGGGAVAAGDRGVIRVRSPGTGAWGPPQGGTFSGQDFVAAATLPGGAVVLASAQGMLVGRSGTSTFAAQGTAPLPSVRALAVLGDRLYAGGGGPGLWLSWRGADGGWTPVLQGASAGATLEALAVEGEGLWLVGEQVLRRLDTRGALGPNLAVGELATAQLRAGAAVRSGELLVGGERGVLAVASADGGLALRSDGPLGAVTALCAAPGGEVLAALGCAGAGCSPALLARSADGRWESVPAPPGALWACQLDDAARGWLAGEGATVYRWDGVTLTPLDLGGSLNGTYTGVWGQPDAGLFLVRQPSGANKRGEVVTAAGLSGPVAQVLKGSGARAVAGVAAAGWVGVVGDNGLLAELDGGAWVVATGPSTNAMRALHASPWGARQAWWLAVGEDAVWTRRGGAPGVEHLPAAELAAAWTFPGGTGWVAGADLATGGALLARRDGGAAAWARVALPPGRPLTALAGVEVGATQRLWVGGDGGLLLRLDTR